MDVWMLAYVAYSFIKLTLFTHLLSCVGFIFFTLIEMGIVYRVFQKEQRRLLIISVIRKWKQRCKIPTVRKRPEAVVVPTIRVTQLSTDDICNNDDNLSVNDAVSDDLEVNAELCSGF